MDAVVWFCFCTILHDNTWVVSTNYHKMSSLTSLHQTSYQQESPQ